jgi:ribosome-associated translation inhibitor RaiA
MNIDIQSLGFPITLALAEHARRRLRFALTRHNDRIQRVVVRLGDENGPRGGADKFCRIRVYLIDAPVAVIADIGSDLYGVIDRTVDRVGRVVVKHLDRSRDSRRRVRGDRPALLAKAFDTTSKSDHTEGEHA